MRIIGCDLHARQQTVAMLDTTMGEVVKMTLKHEGRRCGSFIPCLRDPSSGNSDSGCHCLIWFLPLEGSSATESC
jgi:hypothetical protein